MKRIIRLEISYLLNKFVAFGLKILPVLFYLLVAVAVIICYIYLMDPCQVHYCFDEVQSRIFIAKHFIAEVQADITACTNQLNSECLSQNEISSLEAKRHDLISQRKEWIRRLAEQRAKEAAYLNAEVEVVSRDS